MDSRCNKEEIIFKQLEFFNVVHSGHYDDRLYQAIYQYEQLVKIGIIKKAERE